MSSISTVEYVIDVGVQKKLPADGADAAIDELPGIGSPRWAHELNLPGLRSWRIQGYPWLVFYVEAEANVDVWRVLHAKLDIPTWMEGEGPEASV